LLGDEVEITLRASGASKKVAFRDAVREIKSVISQ